MNAVPNAVRVRRALENAIVDGRFPPGSRLDPEALAQEFECSRTPIREALQQAGTEGLTRTQINSVLGRHRATSRHKDSALAFLAGEGLAVEEVCEFDSDVKTAYRDP